MPWSEKQVRTLRAREHGWMPREGKSGPFGNVSEEKAGEMLAEGERAKTTKRKKSKAQRHALGGGDKY